jgi:hypothetical protein
MDRSMKSQAVLQRVMRGSSTSGPAASPDVVDLGVSFERVLNEQAVLQQLQEQRVVGELPERRQPGLVAQ